MAPTNNKTQIKVNTFMLYPKKFIVLSINAGASAKTAEKSTV